MAVLAKNSITLIYFLDAYGGAVDNDYPGSEEDFYELLGSLEGTLGSIGEELGDLDTAIGEVRAIAEDEMITPSEKVALTGLVKEIERETNWLLTMLPDGSVVSTNLNTAKIALVNMLNSFIDAEDYSDIDMSAYETVHNTYVIWVQEAYEAIEQVRADELVAFDMDITERYAEWVSSIENYEEKIRIESGNLAFYVNNQKMMELTPTALNFYSEGERVSYFANRRMMIDNAMVIEKLHVGNHIIEKHSGNQFTIFKFNG